MRVRLAKNGRSAEHRGFPIAERASNQFGGQSHVQHSADAFAQADWTLSPQWEILGALRYVFISTRYKRECEPAESCE